MAEVKIKKKIVVFTGAGISAESGLSTFRDSDGLWENYPVHEIATKEAFEHSPEMVLSLVDPSSVIFYQKIILIFLQLETCLISYAVSL